MTTRFVEVPASAIRERLQGVGFALQPSFRGEEVYVRRHDKDPKYTIKVYSSIQRGDQDARGRGADAIRVVALLTVGEKVYPIFKSKRVHRTGTVVAVVERMMERAREAYARCNEHRKQHPQRNRPDMVLTDEAHKVIGAGGSFR